MSSINPTVVQSDSQTTQKVRKESWANEHPTLAAVAFVVGQIFGYIISFLVIIAIFTAIVVAVVVLICLL